MPLSYTTNKESRCLNLKIKIDKKSVLIACATIVMVLAFSLFRVYGIIVILSMFFLFFLPSYLILKNSGFEKDELAIYSLFLGLGIVPFLIFVVDKITLSFRLASIVVIIGLYATGIVLPFLSKRRPS